MDLGGSRGDFSPLEDLQYSKRQHITRPELAPRVLKFLQLSTNLLRTLVWISKGHLHWTQISIHSSLKVPTAFRTTNWEASIWRSHVPSRVIWTTRLETWPSKARQDVLEWWREEMRRPFHTQGTAQDSLRASFVISFTRLCPRSVYRISSDKLTIVSWQLGEWPRTFLRPPKSIRSSGIKT